MTKKNNVFINCPLDKDYNVLLKPMIFSLLYMGLQPKLSAAYLDCSEDRLQKIIKLIKESKFSIHDISRMQSKKEKEFFRMNMPFELGIDYGMKKSEANTILKQKQFLILERKAYHYKKALSDISGWDIEAHNDKALNIVKITRKWCVGVKATDFSGTDSEIWENFNYSLNAAFDKMVTKGKKGQARNNMPISEYIKFIEGWINKRRTIDAT